MVPIDATTRPVSQSRQARPRNLWSPAPAPATQPTQPVAEAPTTQPNRIVAETPTTQPTEPSPEESTSQPESITSTVDEEDQEMDASNGFLWPQYSVPGTEY